MIPLEISPATIRILLVQQDLIGALHLRLAIDMAPIPCTVRAIEKDADAVRSLCHSIRAGGDPPDIVLVECDLRERSSQEVLRLLRTSPEIAHVPVVVLGDEDEPSQGTLATLLGANAFLAKPEKASELPRLGRDITRVWQAVAIAS